MCCSTCRTSSIDTGSMRPAFTDRGHRLFGRARDDVLEVRAREVLRGGDDRRQLDAGDRAAGEVVPEDRLARSGASGGRTRVIRSKRPGRSSAGSTSHGAFVAASTNRPSLSADIESISSSSVFTMPRRPDQPEPMLDRRAPIASISSRNSTVGRARLRAFAKTACSFCSRLAEVRAEHVREAHGEEPGAELAGDRAGDEGLAAAGRAVEQQAGRAGDFPNAAATSGCCIGSRKLSRRRCFTSSSPPTSASVGRRPLDVGLRLVEAVVPAGRDLL